METYISDQVADLGFSAERLARVPAFLNRTYIEAGKLAGLAFALYRRGVPVLQTRMGVRDLETNAPITDDTLYRIYSMTKPVTSVALMMLYEQGAIRLEHPVARYLPEFSDMRVYVRGEGAAMETVPATRPMLIRDLLTQTSGLTYDFMNQTPVDQLYRESGLNAFLEDRPLPEFAARLAQMPLLFDPGTRWNYSFSTDVLGRVIEVVSGQTLDAFFKTHIFDPLGMTDTGFQVPEKDVERFSSCYELRPDRTIGKQDDPKTSMFVTGRNFLSGGGGLVSSVDDYVRFCSMLLNKGHYKGVRLLSPLSVDFMTINHLPGNATIDQMGDSLFTEVSTRGAGFGLGFSVVVDRTGTLSPVPEGTYSWGGAANTFFWIDPQQEIVGVQMAQLIPSTAYSLRPQIQTLCYAALTAPTAC